jgi:4-carboxymuconolactone decarboxylase
MTQHDPKEPSGAAKMFGDFAPTLVGFTDDVLFGQVWERAELSPKERSLVTVACLHQRQHRPARLPPRPRPGERQQRN